MATRESLARCTRFHSPVASTALVSLVLGVLVELLPRVGGDLVAQQWWASWAASSGAHPVDLGWYAGSPAVSYSLTAPWVLSLVGPAVAGVVSTTAGATATAALLLRAGAVRPRLAGAAAAGTFAADQLSGRTTFALGTAVGLAALLLAGSQAHPARRRAGAALLAALAGSLSPVAAAFLGLAAAAWWLSAWSSSPADGRRRPHRGRTVDTAALLLGAVTPLAAMTALGAAGGPMTGSAHQLLAAILATAVVVAVLGPDQRLLRVGGALTGVALLASWLVPDPLGSNTTRLVLLFALPVLVGAARRDRIVVGLTAALVVWLLPPLVPRDLGARDTTAFERATAPMLRELAAREPVGRVEVVPLATHQDALLADRVPLARGWTRQLDVARSRLFYDGTLDAGSYLAWLRARGVSWVALAEQRTDWAARAEAALVRDGVPGLTRVWSDALWTLYAVDGPGVVQGPAELVSSDRREVVLDVASAGTVRVALFWDERLSVSGPACIEPGPAGAVLVRADGPGRVVLGSRWRPVGHCAHDGPAG